MKRFKYLQILDIPGVSECPGLLYERFVYLILAWKKLTYLALTGLSQSLSLRAIRVIFIDRVLASIDYSNRLTASLYLSSVDSGGWVILDNLNNDGDVWTSITGILFVYEGKERNYSWL